MPVVIPVVHILTPISFKSLNSTSASSIDIQTIENMLEESKILAHSDFNIKNMSCTQNSTSAYTCDSYQNINQEINNIAKNKLNNIQATQAKLEGPIYNNAFDLGLSDLVSTKYSFLDLKELIATITNQSKGYLETKNFRECQILLPTRISFSYNTNSQTTENNCKFSDFSLNLNENPKAKLLLIMASRLQHHHRPFFLYEDPKAIAYQFSAIEKEMLSEIDWMEVINYRGANIRSLNWNQFIQMENIYGLKLLIGRHEMARNVICKKLNIGSGMDYIPNSSL